MDYLVGIDTRALEESPAGIGVYVAGLLQGLEENKFSRVKAYDKTWGRSFLWHLRVALDVLRRNVCVYHSTHSLILPLLLGPRSVVTIHDLSPLKLPCYHTLKVRLLYKFLLPLALYRVGWVIADSESTAQDLRFYFPKIAAKITTVTLGVSGPDFSWQPEMVSPYLLYLGTLEPRKNIETLIKAYNLFRESSPQMVPLILAGKKGWGKSLQLPEGVILRGEVSEEEKWTLLSRALGFIYPSWYEGFGLPVLEAMKVGVPVITSNVASLPEVVGEAAVLVDPSDPEQLAHEMKRLLESTEHRGHLSSLGRERAKKFSWQDTALKTAEVYSHVYRQNISH